ncbi:hypothetical protein ABT304_12735 [Nocardioides sp. NPDC000445]|uniref:hypothetical protein n=1 Tax=Nocardioides sp. NPDC000445 TaxID=3154257 RepID=UPI00331CFE87
MANVSASRIEIGDVITIPGTPMRRCRVRLIRSAAPGVVWLYLTDSTGERLRRHVALPLDQSVLRHHTAPSDPEQIPEDG